MLLKAKGIVMRFVYCLIAVSIFSGTILATPSTFQALAANWREAIGIENL